MNNLDACIYCKHQQPKNRAQRKRLRDHVLIEQENWRCMALLLQN
jgi:hypothetical protein